LFIRTQKGLPHRKPFSRYLDYIAASDWLVLLRASLS
jgi:hypothetical protein